MSVFGPLQPPTPLGGALSDRFGEKKVMITGAMATLIGTYPILWLMSSAQSWTLVLTAEALLVILAVWFQGPMNALMAQMFPLTSRYRGVAFGYNMGMAIFGGTTSLVATFLTHYFDTSFAPGLYIMVGALMGLMAVDQS